MRKTVTDGRRPERTDGRTDGHHHTIIRPSEECKYIGIDNNPMTYSRSNRNASLASLKGKPRGRLLDLSTYLSL